MTHSSARQGVQSIQLNHIGVAVGNLPELKRFFQVLGLSVTHTEDVPEQGVRTHFLPIPSPGAQIELLEPVDPEGVVGQFVRKRGPGIHHLSFEVATGSLEELCARLKQNGYRLIYDQPRLGAHQMRINFIHPSSAGGILIEMMEKASSS